MPKDRGLREGKDLALLGEDLTRSAGRPANAVLMNLIRQSRVFIAVIALLLLAGIIKPEFLDPNNISNVLRQSAALGTVSIGQTIVMIAGEFDLSVSAIMQLVTVIVAEITRGRNELLLPAVAVCLLMGTLIGFVNGLIISRRKGSSFMVTLAMGLIVTGARLIYTRATPSGTLPTDLRPLSQSDILGAPFSLVLLLALTLIVSIVLRKTTFGRQLYAYGANREAARLSGVPVDWIPIVAFTISGVLAALAGLVLAAYIGYIDQWLGGGYDLDSIAAAAIGGVSLAGGKGGVWGTLAGMLLIRMLMNFVLVVGLPIEYQYVVRGAVVVLAVALYSVRFGK
jgi:ribose/xylose/arabinose/galactoside ABC-type transport system permease subunit